MQIIKSKRDEKSSLTDRIYFFGGLSYSQELVINFGYQESENFETYITGVTSSNIDATLFYKNDGKSRFIFGSRIAFLHHLRINKNSSFYLGPHLGGYFILGNESENNLNFFVEDKLSLNIGGTTGLFLNYINLAVDYGYDGYFRTSYIGLKIGFEFSELFSLARE